MGRRVSALAEKADLVCVCLQPEEFLSVRVFLIQDHVGFPAEHHTHTGRQQRCHDEQPDDSDEARPLVALRPAEDHNQAGDDGDTLEAGHAHERQVPLLTHVVEILF